MVDYRRHGRYRRPYKYNTHRRPLSLYNRLRGKYSPRSGSGGYRPQTPYILSHRLLRYQPEQEYRPRPELKTSQPVIVQRSEPTTYRMPKMEYKEEPDIEELLERLEKRFDAKLESQAMKLLEKESIISQAESARQQKLDEYAGDESTSEEENHAEKTKIDEISIGDLEDATRELHEDEVTEEEFQRDIVLSDEAETFSESQADELSELEEAVSEPVELPPEESAEPAESVEELAEAVMEDPVLASDLEPEMLAEIESFVNDLEAEELEPEEEYVEPGC